jgi:hypothetical protein
MGSRENNREIIDFGMEMGGPRVKQGKLLGSIE